MSDVQTSVKLRATFEREMDAAWARFMAASPSKSFDEYNRREKRLRDECRAAQIKYGRA